MSIFDSWLVRQPIAHRGLHTKEIPELSISSFENAIKKGYAIEVDVRQLKDGTSVIFHDEKLSRMTGIDGYITNFSLEQIKKLKLSGTNQQIPTFKELLEAVNGRTPLLIEIKNMDKPSFEKNVLNELKNYKGEYAIQSFNPFVLEWFRENAPEIKRGQLSGYFEGEDLSPIRKFALKRMYFNKKVSQPNFIAYEAKHIPNRHLKKHSSLPLLAWCVRSQEEYDRLKKYVDNIIFEGFDPIV